MPSNDRLTKEDLEKALQQVTQQVIGEMNRQNLGLRTEMKARFEEVSSRFEEVNARFAALDKKLEEADQREVERFQQQNNELNARFAAIYRKLDEADLREVARFQEQTQEIGSRFAAIDKKFIAANDRELERYQELYRHFGNIVLKRYDRLDERIEEVEHRVSEAVSSYQVSGDTHRGLYDLFRVERYALDHAISRHQTALDRVQADLAKMNERISALEAKRG